MVKIWRPGDNFCAFERILEMVDLKFFFALMKKRQFCPIVHSVEKIVWPILNGVINLV
jgi:hypothetical protein